MLKQLAPILLAGIGLELGWIAMRLLGPLRACGALFPALVLAMFAVVLWAFFRLPIQAKPQLFALLAFALLFRLTVVSAPPDQSEDVYRYIWDARVAAAGISPYRYPPSAPELAHLRDAAVYELINSKPYVTAYPPVSQLLFRLARAIAGESVTAMKGLFSSLEFAALLVAARLVWVWKLPLEPLYLVAWSPFFVFEFSYSGHSDSAMILAALLSFYLLERGHVTGAMASYAAAVLSKLHPALWCPLLGRRCGWRRALVAPAVALALAAAYYTPSSLVAYVRSLGLYLRLFEFNAGIHYLLRWIGRVTTGEAWDQRTGPYLAAALLVVSAAIWLRFPLRTTRDVVHAAFWLMTADLALATTVHPWYLAWAALALPFFPYAFMTWWTAASVLSYLAYGYRPVHEPTWVALVEYVPMFALMAVEIARGAPLLARRPRPGAEAAAAAAR
jgi:hypothetical protein